MLNALLFGAALACGQTDAAAPPRAHLLAPVGSTIVFEQPKSAQPAGDAAPAADASGSRTGLVGAVRGLFDRFSQRAGGHAAAAESTGDSEQPKGAKASEVSTADATVAAPKGGLVQTVGGFFDRFGHRVWGHAAGAADATDTVVDSTAPPSSSAATCTSCSCCNVVWLKRWTCEDLQLRPAEHACCESCGFLRGLFWRSRVVADGATNVEEIKIMSGIKTASAVKTVSATDEKSDADAKKIVEGHVDETLAVPPPELNPLMQSIQCRFPCLFQRLECSGVRVYGWLEAGYTINTDSPRDRLNFGTNFNNRSNDLMLNQLYLVVEKPIDLDCKKDCFQLGYRVDFAYGHDAANWANFGLGLFDHFTGSHAQNARTFENGLDMPQAYVEAHLPGLTNRGTDLRVGRFYRLLGGEQSPATATDFYSHSYEYGYALPYTHTGVLATTHVADTVDVYNGLVRGWDVVFSDFNDSLSYIGGATWTACDKRRSLAFGMVTGPERQLVDPGNNHFWRTVMTAYYTQKFGCCDRWRLVTGGNLGWEPGTLVSTLAPGRHAAEWYGYNTSLFYTVDPRLTLGLRAEWFRDDDGARTTFFNDQFSGNRPGYAGNFYEVTLGATWRPYQNLRIRPELRFDWYGGPATFGSLPYNDQKDRLQTTLGVDFIWEF